MTDDLARLTATDLLPRLADGSITASALADACLAVVAAREAAVGAWVHIDAEQVRAQAAVLDDRRRSGGPVGPLHGLPVGLKDIIDTADMPTENGAAADRGRQPGADAALVETLRAAGAVIMGKTVTAELAHRAPGRTANPHDPARTPGGSSSGSAAAVAAFMAPLAVGTQTGGSVIRPAAYCGIVGFKPTAGAIPTDGVFRRSHTLDTIGVFGRSVADTALLAGVLAGPAPLGAAPPEPARQLRFALVRQPGWAQADADMQKAFAGVGAALGAQATPVDLPPPFDRALEAHRVISLVELARYASAAYLPDRAAGLSASTLEDVAIGAAFRAAEYDAALALIPALTTALGPIFEDFDALVTPAAPGQAPVGLGNTGPSTFCSIWTLCGTPAVSLPLLRGADGLPMGLQLVGWRGGDVALLQSAAWLCDRLGGCR